jgi:hypothetical protein
MGFISRGKGLPGCDRDVGKEAPSSGTCHLCMVTWSAPRRCVSSCRTRLKRSCVGLSPIPRSTACVRVWCVCESKRYNLFLFVLCISASQSLRLIQSIKRQRWRDGGRTHNTGRRPTTHMTAHVIFSKHRAAAAARGAVPGGRTTQTADWKVRSMTRCAASTTDPAASSADSDEPLSHRPSEGGHATAMAAIQP